MAPGDQLVANPACLRRGQQATPCSDPDHRIVAVDLTGANLRGADLSNTRLDRTVLIHADLAGANLSGASILRPTVYTDLEENLARTAAFRDLMLTTAGYAAEHDLEPMATDVGWIGGLTALSDEE